MRLKYFPSEADENDIVTLPLPEFWPLIKNLRELKETLKVENSLSKFYVKEGSFVSITSYTYHLDSSDIGILKRYVIPQSEFLKGNTSTNWRTQDICENISHDKEFSDYIPLSTTEFERFAPQLSRRFLGTARIESPLFTMRISSGIFLRESERQLFESYHIFYKIFYSGEEMPKAEVLEWTGKEIFEEALNKFDSDGSKHRIYIPNRFDGEKIIIV